VRVIISLLERFLGWKTCKVCKVQSPSSVVDYDNVCMLCKEELKTN
jgi:hypothetical protein